MMIYKHKWEKRIRGEPVFKVDTQSCNLGVIKRVIRTVMCFPFWFKIKKMNDGFN